VGDVGHKNLHCFRIAGHKHWVLVFLHDKLQPPQSVRRWPKPATNSWPLSVTDEPETRWKEEIVDLLRCVPELPKWKTGMALKGRRGELQIHRNPGFVVSKADEGSVFWRYILSIPFARLTKIFSPSADLWAQGMISW
jgi:hypothetical protein